MDWVRVDAAIDGPHAAAALEDVAYSGSRYVAVGEYATYTDSYPLILWSDDGADWHRVDAPTGNESVLWGVAHGGSQFVAVGGVRNENGYLTPVIATSPDGISWTEQDPGTGSLEGFFGLYSIAYGNGTFVAAGNYLDGDEQQYLILTSSDGESWVQQDAGISPTPVLVPGLDVSYVQALIFGGGTFVAIAQDSAASITRILTSADGEIWSEQDSGLDADVYIVGMASITYGAGNFVISAYTLTREPPYTERELTLLSTDGTTWAEEEFESELALGSVLGFGDGQFVAWRSYSRVLSSSDAITWTEESVTADPYSALYKIVFGDGLFVGVGVGATRDPLVMTSESVGGGGWGISL